MEATQVNKIITGISGYIVCSEWDIDIRETNKQEHRDNTERQPTS